MFGLRAMLLWPRIGAVLFAALLLCVAGPRFASGRSPQATPKRLSVVSSEAAAAVASTLGPEGRYAVDPRGRLKWLSRPHERGAGGRSVSDSAARAQARDFVLRRRQALSGGIERSDFSVRRSVALGRGYAVRLSQTYSGLPVYGAEVVVQTDGAGRVVFLLADLMDAGDDLSGKVALRASVPADKARRIAEADAIERGASEPFAEDEVEAVLFAPEVAGAKGSPRLAWRLRVGDARRLDYYEEVLIDARSGRVLFRQALAHAALWREIYDADGQQVQPGTLIRSEGEPLTGLGEADLLYDCFGDTYDFYLRHHGRDGLNGQGGTLLGIVRYPGQNAGWSAINDRMIFSEGFVADDVVAHEFTHGVTFHTSRLNYSYQSGAINESFSDMWGEWVDLSNSLGTDTPEVRWLIGEDLTPEVGAVRDMSDPTVFGHPDRMGSPFYYKGEDDYGGVHTNSGVGNKLCYLLTDGGAFNGQSVQAMGIETMAALFYETQTALLPQMADYQDLYYAAAHAAVNQGWSEADRENLSRAFQAVEIQPQAPRRLRARSRQATPYVFLDWEFPTQPGARGVVVRQSDERFPTDPLADGVLVYSGVGTATLSGPFTPGETRYFSAWADYGQGEYSGAVYAQAVAGHAPPDYFTELYGEGQFDLHNYSITFTPDGSEVFYSAAGGEAYAFFTDPAGAVPLAMRDDEFLEIALAPGRTVSLYGQAYARVFLGSNGYLTFTEGDDWMVETFENHFDRPRVSALYDDLDPAAGGMVSYKELDDRIAVTFQDVPEWAEDTRSSFQIEMFYDGRIRMTWLDVGAADGLAGLSAGFGAPADFVASDLSVYYPQFLESQEIEISADGHFHAAPWNLTTGDYPWGGSLDTFLAGDLTYYLAPRQWIGVLLYDYDTARYAAAVYLHRQ